MIYQPRDMNYEPRTMRELIDTNKYWNINDYINFKSMIGPENWYAYRKQFKNKTIIHIQQL